MKHVTILIVVLAALASQTQLRAAEPDITKSRQVTLSGSELLALQSVLGSLERRERMVKDKDGERTTTEAIPVCLDIGGKKELHCVPHEVSLVVARDLRALQVAITDYQTQARTIQGEESGGTGYIDQETTEGRRAGARANFRLASLSAKPWPLVYWPVDLAALSDRQLGVSSTNRAVIAMVQPEVLE